MTEIKKLIELWNARPQRAEPDNEQHLLYLFTGLLPALRDAMPRIVELIELQASVAPNTDLPPAPAPEPSTHNPTQIPSTDGNVVTSGPATDSGDMCESSPASVGETEPAASPTSSGPGKRAKTTRARKPAAAPHAQPQGTAATVPI